MLWFLCFINCENLVPWTITKRTWQTFYKCNFFISYYFHFVLTLRTIHSIHPSITQLILIKNYLSCTIGMDQSMLEISAPKTFIIFQASWLGESHRKQQQQPKFLSVVLWAPSFIHVSPSGMIFGRCFDFCRGETSLVYFFLRLEGCIYGWLSQSSCFADGYMTDSSQFSFITFAVDMSKAHFRKF